MNSRHWTRIMGLAAAVLSLAVRAAQATDWYCATNGVPGDGKSWGQAFTNLQTALNSAGSADNIYLAAHTFPLNNTQLLWTASGVTMRGGYAGSGTPGPFTNVPSIIIRTNGNWGVLKINGVTNGVLDQVTITGGKEQNYSVNPGGGGLNIVSCSNLTVSSCVIATNMVAPGGGGGAALGGGAYVSGSSVLFTNCLFKRNTATYGSGGLGGGLYVASGLVALRDVVFDSNTANGKPSVDTGSGLYAAGIVNAVNCLFSGNVGYGAVIYAATNVTLGNCTVAYQPLAAGIQRAGGTVAASNSIFWANGDDITGGVSLVSCDIKDGDSNGVAGCLSADPLFQYGYYLGAGSPCVDAGSVTAAAAGLAGYTTRTDGTADSGQVDLGYHYAGAFSTTYADLYVATNGDNANTGTTSLQPFRTITKALSVAQDGSHIHIASGSYTNGSETFPLVGDNKWGLQLLGTNCNTTIINAAGATKKVLSLSNLAGFSRLEGVAIIGGVENTQNAPYGGGLYLYNCANATIASCAITNNSATPTGGSTAGMGGGLYATLSMVTITNCVIEKNVAQYGTSGGKGGGLHLASGTATLRDTVIDNNLVGWSGANDQGNGIYAAGILSAYNCLIYGNAGLSAGLYALTNASLGNCTVAYNSGPGVYRGGGTVAVSNSIIWANMDDITGAVSLVSCDITDGDSNGVAGCFSADPLFEYGYYLGAGSPCVDTGSVTAVAAGLDGRTTQTGGTTDSGLVDLGYHYSGAFSLTYADIYVATNGLDSNTGTNSLQAFRTITKGLSLAQNGSRIHVATGSYTNLSETYPLVLDGKAGLQLLGAGTSTVINAAGASQRAMTLRFLNDAARVDGFTITGGKDTQTSDANQWPAGGAALWLYNCVGLTVANCVITNNTVVPGGGSGPAYGGGLRSRGTIATVTNCVIEKNSIVYNGASGGGLYQDSGNLWLRDCILDNNSLSGNANNQGIAVYAAGTLAMNNCLVYGNAGSYGASLYGSSNLTVQNCTVADSTRPGIYGSGNGVNVANSIFWGNADDITGTVALASCDIQDGDSNGVNGCFSSNPAFEAGQNVYYLTPSSPCVDTGNVTAVAAGLSGRTTMKDGTLDTGVVDLGWHYAFGQSGGAVIIYTSIYVSATSGNDSNDGTNWPTAFQSLTKAFSKVINGSVVYVGAGVYTNGLETFPLALDGKNNVAILGTNRVTTTINATGGGRQALRLNNLGGVSRIEGLTVTGGGENIQDAALGGGIYINNCGNLTIASCAIANNMVNPGGGNNSALGGGVYIAGSSGVTLTNCLVERNTACYNSKGGGIYVGGGSLAVRDSIIDQNAISAGGNFVGQEQGSAIYAAVNVVLQNCLVYGNWDQVGFGSGIFQLTGSLAIGNCTVAYHNGPGVGVAVGASASVSNSIVWGNVDDLTGSVALVSCDIGDGDSNGVAGCFSADPLFQYGYYLGVGSPCVDTGSVTAAVAGLSGRTTRTDGTSDASQVDLGWHYPTGLNWSAIQPDLYVSASTGSDANMGTNAASPFKTITKAFSQVTDGTRVHIAAGSYTNGAETFPLALNYNAGVQILGAGRDTTVINAAGTNQRVMTLTGLTGASHLEGLTVTGGKDTQIADWITSGGGGLMFNDCAGLTIGACEISNNAALPGGGNGYNTQAGGVLVLASAVTLTNSTIEKNTCAYNNLNVFGCGVAVRQGGQLTAFNCIIRTNMNSQTAGAGGGVYVGPSAAAILRNCLVYGNDTGYGDGIFATNCTLTLENCTIVTNLGQGLCVGGVSSVSAVNTILWQNGMDVTGAVSLAYCDIQNGNTNGAIACLSADPQFRGASAGDYRLASASPCIDAGTNLSWSATATDLAGNPRRVGARPDMGAYESQYRGTVFSVR